MNDIEKNSKKNARVRINIPWSLHLIAKQAYRMQGIDTSDKYVQLIKADLKKAIKKPWFNKLSEEDKEIFRYFIESKDGDNSE